MKGTKMRAVMSDVSVRGIDGSHTRIRLKEPALTVSPSIGTYGSIVDVFDSADPGSGTSASIWLSREQVDQLIAALKEAQ